MSNSRLTATNYNIARSKNQSRYMLPISNSRGRSSKRIVGSITPTNKYLGSNQNLLATKLTSFGSKKSITSAQFTPSQEILSQLLSCACDFSHHLLHFIRQLAQANLHHGYLMPKNSNFQNFENLIEKLLGMNERLGVRRSNFVSDLRILVNSQERIRAISSNFAKLSRGEFDYNQVGTLLRQVGDTIEMHIQAKTGSLAEIRRRSTSKRSRSPLQTRMSSHKKRNFEQKYNNRSTTTLPGVIKPEYNQHPEFVKEVLKPRYVSKKKKSPLNSQFKDLPSSNKSIGTGYLYKMNRSSSFVKPDLSKYNENRSFNKTFTRSPINSQGKISNLSNIATAKKHIRVENSRRSIIKQRQSKTPLKSKILFPQFSPLKKRPSFQNHSPFRANQGKLKIERETVLISSSTKINHGYLQRTPTAKNPLKKMNFRKQSHNLSVSHSVKQIPQGDYSEALLRSKSSKKLVSKGMDRSSGKVIVSNLRNRRGKQMSLIDNFHSRSLSKPELNQSVNLPRRSKGESSYLLSKDGSTKGKKMVFKNSFEKMKLQKRKRAFQDLTKKSNLDVRQRLFDSKKSSIDVHKESLDKENIISNKKSLNDRLIEDRKRSDGVVSFNYNSGNNYLFDFDKTTGGNNKSIENKLSKKTVKVTCIRQRGMSESQDIQDIKDKLSEMAKNSLSMKKMQKINTSKSPFNPRATTMTITPPISILGKKIEKNILSKNQEKEGKMTIIPPMVEKKSSRDIVIHEKRRFSSSNPQISALEGEPIQREKGSYEVSRLPSMNITPISSCVRNQLTQPTPKIEVNTTKMTKKNSKIFEEIPEATEDYNDNDSHGTVAKNISSHSFSRKGSDLKSSFRKSLQSHIMSKRMSHHTSVASGLSLIKASSKKLGSERSKMTLSDFVDKSIKEGEMIEEENGEDGDSMISNYGHYVQEENQAKLTQVNYNYEFSSQAVEDSESDSSDSEEDTDTYVTEEESRSENLATFRGEKYNGTKTENFCEERSREHEYEENVTVPGRINSNGARVLKNGNFRLDSNSILMQTDLSHQIHNGDVPSLDEIFLTGNVQTSNRTDKSKVDETSDDRDEIMRTGSSSNNVRNICFNNQEWQTGDDHDGILSNRIFSTEKPVQNIETFDIFDKKDLIFSSAYGNERQVEEEEEKENLECHDSRGLSPVAKHVQPSSFVNRSRVPSKNQDSAEEMERTLRKQKSKGEIGGFLNYNLPCYSIKSLSLVDEVEAVKETGKQNFEISLLKKKSQNYNCGILEGWQTISSCQSNCLKFDDDIQQEMICAKTQEMFNTDDDLVIKNFKKKPIKDSEEKALSVKVKPTNPDFSNSKSKKMSSVFSPDNFRGNYDDDLIHSSHPIFPNIPKGINKSLDYNKLTKVDTKLDFNDKMSCRGTQKSIKKRHSSSLKSPDSYDMKTISSSQITKDFPNVSEESFPFENIQNYQSKYQQLNFTYQITEITEKSEESSTRKLKRSVIRTVEKRQMRAWKDNKVSVTNPRTTFEVVNCKPSVSVSSPSAPIEVFSRLQGQSNGLNRSKRKRYRCDFISRKDCRTIRDCQHSSWVFLKSRGSIQHPFQLFENEELASIQFQQTNSFKSLNSITNRNNPAGELLRVYLKGRGKMSPKPNLPVSPSIISSFQENSTITFDASLKLKKEDTSVSDFSEIRSEKDEFMSMKGQIRGKRGSLDSAVKVKLNFGKKEDFSSLKQSHEGLMSFGKKREADKAKKRLDFSKKEMESEFTSFRNLNLNVPQVSKRVESEPREFKQPEETSFSNQQLTKESSDNDQFHPFVHLDNSRKSMNESIYNSNSFDHFSIAKGEDIASNEIKYGLEKDGYDSSDDFRDNFSFNVEGFSNRNEGPLDIHDHQMDYMSEKEVSNAESGSIDKQTSDRNEAFLRYGRNVQPLIDGQKRLYPPKDKSILRFKEAYDLFGIEPIGAAINVNQSNGSRIDIGMGGLIAYGGDFLSFAKEVRDPYSSCTSLRFIHTDEDNSKI